MRFTIAILSLASCCANFTTFATEQLPARLLSGYTGHFLKGEAKVPDQLRQTFTAMRQAGFNTVEVKLQQSRAPYMNAIADRAEIAAILGEAQEQKLQLQIYLYPEPYHAKRTQQREKHQLLPAAVDRMGKTIEHSFMLREIKVWRELFHHAYDFAKLTLEMPIAALKFDIETIATIISYDDDSWQKFGQQSQVRFADNLPADKRHQALEESNAVDAYREFFIAGVAQAVKQFAAELHAINPRLVLGYMPYSSNWIARGFNAHLATADAPAIIDDWCMYNGNGFSSELLANRDLVKQANPNNLYIPWFRVNSYFPGDLDTQAYYAGAASDGYSMWTMTMLSDEGNPRTGYQLPDNTKPQEYYQAFKKANEALLADLTAGTIAKPERIAWKELQPLVPALQLEEINVPKLKPAGNGSQTPGTESFVLRNQQTIFIYARAGEDLNVTLRHLAGKQRPTALVYALLDAEKNILRSEAVMPGDHESFRVAAPHEGVFALVVSGGVGGLAWYGVRVGNPYFAVDARQSAYFFRPQTVYVSGVDQGNPELKVGLQATESHIHSLNDGPKIHLQRQGPVTITLPPGVVKVKFEESPVSWSQNFILSFPKGKIPYVYASPERLLMPE